MHSTARMLSLLPEVVSSGWYPLVVVDLAVFAVLVIFPLRNLPLVVVVVVVVVVLLLLLPLLPALDVDGGDEASDKGLIAANCPTSSRLASYSLNFMSKAAAK